MVATPIGNLQDITLRALEVLAGADLVAAEDTRVASVLLRHHGIATPLLAVHEHNETQAARKVVERLQQGRSVALVTDAGTPAVSDPGAIVVNAVRAAGFPVSPVPGPSAAAAAVSVAGLRDSRFLFAGFLPPAPAARRREIAALKPVGHALVIYEAPHRIAACLQDLALGLGPERGVVICRELTKRFEEVHACMLGEAASWLQGDPNRGRGEFVLVVGGAPAPEADAQWEAIDRALGVLLPEVPLAQAVKLACALTGERRNRVYERALALSRGPGG